MDLSVRPVSTIRELQEEIARQEKQWATSGQNGSYDIQLTMAGGQVKSIRQSIEAYSRPGDVTKVSSAK